MSKSIDYSEDELSHVLSKGFEQDPLITIKFVFFAGDIKAGLGRRKFFRDSLDWLMNNHPDLLIKNIQSGNIQHFNRWDSLFLLRENFEVHKTVLEVIKHGLIEACDANLAKWLPRKKTYRNFASVLRMYLGLNFKDYRKLLVSKSQTVETKLCSKKYDEINLNELNATSLTKYKLTLQKNVPNEFEKYIAKYTQRFNSQLNNVGGTAIEKPKTDIFQLNLSQILSFLNSNRYSRVVCN